MSLEYFIPSWIPGKGYGRITKIVPSWQEMFAKLVLRSDDSDWQDVVRRRIGNAYRMLASVSNYWCARKFDLDTLLATFESD